MNQLYSLLLLALLASCAKHESNSPKLISISFDGTLDWSSTSVTSNDGISKHDTFIEGMQYSLDLDEGTLHIGDESFSGLVPGDKIMIGGNGILVNGKHRWDLPQPAED